MKRRSVLLGLSGFGLLAAGVTWRVARASPQSGVLAVIHKRLGYLSMDSEGLQRFANDVVARRAVSNTHLRLLSASRSLYAKTRFTGILAEELRRGEENIVTLYLMSSDFFVNPGAATVRYVEYYDPLRACSSPFARPMMRS